MLRIIPIFVILFCVSVFALVFEDSGLDSLTLEQKQQISALVAEQKKGISANRIKLGIVSDVKNGEKQLVNLIKSYITDSLELKSNVILEKKFPWTPTLEMPVKNVRPIIVEVIPVTNFFHSALIMVVDSTNTQIKGDTITTAKDGFALIRYNNNHRITLHENTKIVLSHSSVSLLKGNLSISQSREVVANQYIMPLKIKTDKGEFDIVGNAFVSVGERNVAQIYDGKAFSKTASAKDTVLAGNAISISAQNSVLAPLLRTPVLFRKNSFTALPGDLIKFPNTSNFKQRIIVANAKNEKIIDAIADADDIFLPLQFGNLQYFVQDIDENGVVSAWSKTNITLRKLNGLKSIDIFDDTLFYTTDDRPFTYRGIADTSVQLFIDNQEIAISKNGEFSHKVMLKDSLNYPEIIVLYKDLSGDTLLPTIFYTGWDERIKMNDSLMNKPAFTTSRMYKWRGIAPTAVSIRINNEEIEIKKDGSFEKTIRVRPYMTYPVLIDIIYENGNSKTITRTLTREKYVSSGELGLREGLFVVLATAIISGIIAISIIENKGD